VPKSEKDYSKAKQLQRLLLNKNSTILYGIRRATLLNGGWKTPGIDGMVLRSHPERMALYYMLKSIKLSEYEPSPVRRVYIRKSNGKMRPLGIPTIIDRVYQTVVNLALEPRVEVDFEPTSYGFRPIRNADHAIAHIHNYTKRGNRSWVFEGDFKSCFNTLDHDWILKQLGNFPAKKIIDKWLKSGYIHNDMFDLTDMGTPQGGIISPTLVNIALTSLDEALGVTYKKLKPETQLPTKIGQNTL